MLKTYSKLFKNTIRTISNWKQENRPIIALLEKYFTKRDLEEFLEKGSIPKYDVLQEQELVFKYAKQRYFEILGSIGSLGDIINKDFMDFYFSVLVFAKNNIEQQTIYSPFDIQKSSILYATHNKYIVEKRNDELMPKFEAGIELISHFDCYVNQFVLANIMQEFRPMMSIEIDSSEFKVDVKVEAYLHTLLFVLYELHPDKDFIEKKVILFSIINQFYAFFNVPTFNEHNIEYRLEHMSFDTMLKKNFDMVQKHFDKLLQVLKMTKNVG